MELFNRTVKKFAKKASIAVTESVKIEAKKTAISILPTVLGIGAVVAGFAIFKSSLVQPTTMASSTASVIPTLSRTSIVTNNYFFDPSVQAEIVSKLMKK